MEGKLLPIQQTPLSMSLEWSIGKASADTHGSSALTGVAKTLLYTALDCLKAVLNWAEHSVHEQLCLLEMFKLAVWFLIDVFDLGEQLCSRPMGMCSDVWIVGSTGYGGKLLIGRTLFVTEEKKQKRG